LVDSGDTQKDRELEIKDAETSWLDVFKEIGNRLGVQTGQETDFGTMIEKEWDKYLDASQGLFGIDFEVLLGTAFAQTIRPMVESGSIDQDLGYFLRESGFPTEKVPTVIITAQSVSNHISRTSESDLIRFSDAAETFQIDNIDSYIELVHVRTGQSKKNIATQQLILMERRMEAISSPYLRTKLHKAFTETENHFEKKYGATKYPLFDKELVAEKLLDDVLRGQVDKLQSQLESYANVGYQETLLSEFLEQVNTQSSQLTLTETKNIVSAMNDIITDADLRSLPSLNQPQNIRAHLTRAVLLYSNGRISQDRAVLYLANHLLGDAVEAINAIIGNSETPAIDELTVNRLTEKAA